MSDDGPNQLRDRYFETILKILQDELRKNGHRIDPIEMMKALAKIAGLVLSTAPDEERGPATVRFMVEVCGWTEDIKAEVIELERAGHA